MKLESAFHATFADRVAVASGLSGMLADGALRRCCNRIDVELDRLGPSQLERLLPHLRGVLLLYLSADEAHAAMVRLRRLLPY